MKSPFTGKEMKLIKENRTMVFRKETFVVIFHAYRCEDTGEQFEDDKLAELNYNQLVNQYREKHAIPFPEQIKKTREKYGVSAKKMAEILGFGVNNYRHYENGEIPNISNANLITLIEDPHEFQKLLDKNTTISVSERKKISNRIQGLIQHNKEMKVTRWLMEYFLGSGNPNSLTGYKVPDLEKLVQMILFFSRELQPFKTKMNKLLFYSDFLHFRQTGFSISGTQYRAIPRGPVPSRYDGLYEFLTDHNKINIREQVFSDDVVGDQFLPAKENLFNPELFSENELEVLNKIAKRFQKTTTKEIIEKSHEEKAWQENQTDHKLIDYKYSFDLNEFP